MRIGDILRTSRAYEAALQAAPPAPDLEAAYAPTQIGPASWASEPNALQSIVWHDLIGTDGPLGRAAAMGIPALARQRHLLTSTISRNPLRSSGTDTAGTVTDTTAANRWMWRTDKAVHPYFRMLWTVDDLLFHGWSVWSTERGVDGLMWADRIHPDLWEIDEVGRIFVDGELAKADQVLAIPGPHEGILNFGASTLQRTIDNLEAAANAARNPSAYLELHYTGDDDLTDEEVRGHIQYWADARKGINGGVAWTNKAIELKEHGTHESHLLIEGRNADAVDVSRLVSSPAAMADAEAGSLTYETTEGRNAQFIDYGTGMYMDAIQARLSMDDVVPRGQRVYFDTAEQRTPTPSPTGAQTLD